MSILKKRSIFGDFEDSVKFILDEDEFERPVKVERPVKIEPDSCQLTARIPIRQPASAASASSDEKPGPSGTAYCTKALTRIRSGQLGPADPPRGRSRPKGSKSRPRIPKVFGLPVPPERAAATKARAEMASSSKQWVLGGSYANPPQVDRLSPSADGTLRVSHENKRLSF